MVFGYLAGVGTAMFGGFKKQASLSEETVSMLVGAGDSYKYWLSVILAANGQYPAPNSSHIFDPDQYSKLTSDEKAKFTYESTINANLTRVKNYNNYILPELNENNKDVLRRVGNLLRSPDPKWKEDFSFDGNSFLKGLYDEDLRSDKTRGKPVRIIDQIDPKTRFTKDVAELERGVVNGTEKTAAHQYHTQLTNVELTSALVGDYQIFSQPLNGAISDKLRFYGKATKFHEFSSTVDFYEPMTQQPGDKYRITNYKNFTDEERQNFTAAFNKKRLTKEKYVKFNSNQKATISFLTTDATGPMQAGFGLRVNAMHPGADSVLIKQMFMRSSLLMETFTLDSKYIMNNFDDPNAKLSIQKPNHYLSKPTFETYSIKEFFKERFGVEDKSQITKKHLVDAYVAGSDDISNNLPLARNNSGGNAVAGKVIEFLIKCRVDMDPAVNKIPDGNLAKIFDFGPSVHFQTGLFSVVSYLKKGTTTKMMIEAAGPLIKGASDLYSSNGIKDAPERLNVHIENEHGSAPKIKSKGDWSFFKFEEIDIKPQAANYKEMVMSKREPEDFVPTGRAMMKLSPLKTIASLVGVKGGVGKVLGVALLATTGVIGVSIVLDKCNTAKIENNEKNYIDDRLKGFNFEKDTTQPAPNILDSSPAKKKVSSGPAVNEPDGASEDIIDKQIREYKKQGNSKKDGAVNNKKEPGTYLLGQDRVVSVEEGKQASNTIRQI